ncbi:MAG: 2-oxoglutarate dehydrogenase complex dihydrolipoyllysine-residue succinyltransferase [Verrucomicrobia bacterium]|nr:2-oxoglutarate dehydrogenase complex dihydrolipoyllysine-residue succinyltransferase [Verrucomicrobiota bacterium]
MAIELKVPSVGESINEVEIGEWRKAKGDSVQKDETVAVLESEKATVELPSPFTGTVGDILKRKGETATIGEVIGYIEQAGKQAEAKSAEQIQQGGIPTGVQPRVMPAAQRALAEHGIQAEAVKPTGPGERLLKEDVMRHVEAKSAAAEPKRADVIQKPGEPLPARPKTTHSTPSSAAKATTSTDREEEVVPMSRLRRTLAERLVEAQHNAALLTTFNEIDMSEGMALRRHYGEAFQAKYGLKLGFMSFFVKAAIDALKAVPQVNAEIRGTDIVYHNYYDIGVAIGGGKGLVVPVLRNAERMSFAEIEIAISDFARRAKENKLKLEELQGGTFTISNGGVYGSLLSTPIINPPQSGILGMHTIQERPVARDGAVVIRPMMYVALTYDHRIVDGREGVTFLKRIKEVIENPARMLIEV